MNTEQGVSTMLCVQLYTTGRTYGGLNLYSKAEDGFDDHDQAVVLALAAHAAVAMAAVVESDNLNIALHTRTVIGQAEGILMERFDVTADQAFAVLSRVSQAENRRLGEVAAELVATRVTPGT